MLKFKNQRDTILYHLAASVLAIIMIYPLIWMVFSSFKSNDEIFTTATSLWPTTWQAVENYTRGWQGVMNVTFGTFMKNSFIVSSVSTVLCITSSLLAAYAFARIPFKFKSFWFACVMVTMMVPSQVMIVPQYIIFKNLGLIDTLAALTMPWIFGGAFFIFLILQFLRGLPIELDEAAEIDGCNKFQTLFRILLPNIIPALVTGAIFCFYWSWQEFFQALVFLNSIEKYTVSLGLNLYLDPETSVAYGAIFAMAVVSLLPVLIVFVIFQKQLVEGVASTGIKG